MVYPDNGLQVLSNEFPWPEFRWAGIVRSLYQGQKPPRPSSRPINDLHWAFLETCWLDVQDRPPASSAFLAFYSFLTLTT